MKILLIGNGGRENAIARKIYNSNLFKSEESKIFCTIGNPGINKLAEPVNINPTEIENLVEFSLKEKIDFTVVGPEIPLSMGIVNEFENTGLKIFGPRREAALIESSKVFSKKLMSENNIPTAKFKNFSKDNYSEAINFLAECDYPSVIKADGLAAGKGVVIANSINEATETVKNLTEDNLFGKAGDNFIIEEFLNGEEISVFAITDGEDFVLLPFSQDHKKIYDGDTGPNTGGMGAVAPLKKFMNENLEKKIKDKIISPVLTALKKSNAEFKGCLYCGLMIVDDEPYVIEFNCRFGDPETQAVLPLIKSDFLELLLASANNDIKNYKLSLFEKYSCCVVIASDGYPGNYQRGKEITGLNDAENYSHVFHSGTFQDPRSKVIFSNGGRVLSVVGISDYSLEDAVKNTYKGVDKINFENKYYRRDIGYRQLIVNS